MLHTTLVLSNVPSFWLLNRDFPPNNPSALSIFNYRSGSQTFSVIPHFEHGGLFKPHLSLIAPIKWWAKPPTLPEGTQVQVWPDVFFPILFPPLLRLASCHIFN